MKDCVSLILQELNDREQQDINETIELYKSIRHYNNRTPITLSLQLFKKLALESINEHIKIGLSNIRINTSIGPDPYLTTTFLQTFFISIVRIYLYYIPERKNLESDYLILTEDGKKTIYYPKKYEPHIKYLLETLNLKIYYNKELILEWEHW